MDLKQLFELGCEVIATYHPNWVQLTKLFCSSNDLSGVVVFSGFSRKLPE